MEPLPFTMTPKAAAYIEKILIDSQREPHFLKFAMILGCTPSGIRFIWHLPAVVTQSEDYVEMDLMGFKVFCYKANYEKLRGKQIDLKERVRRPELVFRKNPE